MVLLTWLERLLIVIGSVCLLAFGASLARAASFQRIAALTLERELAAATVIRGVSGRLEIPRLSVSMRTARGIFDYRVSRTEVVGSDERSVSAPPEFSVNESAPVVHGLIGRLEIPRLNVSVMVMQGDDDATLARAVGHLSDSALPWERGNAVIAGHRDTFFRPLKNVREGDEIRMTTARGIFDYRVIGTRIVAPDDLSVLTPTEIRSLTLVTCYPFFYIGSAPQRFIIHARSPH
jgi:sortase A